MPPAVESRYRAARAQVDDVLRGRGRAKEAAVWRALLAREQLCEELDALALAGGTQAGAASEPDAVESVRRRWDALAPVAPAWESRLAARRDAAVRALTSEAGRVREEHLARIRDSDAARRDALLELELVFGLPSPDELQAQRLAVQVKHLRDRFKRSASGGSGADEVLLEWSALPGVTREEDRRRCERIVDWMERRGVGRQS